MDSVKKILTHLLGLFTNFVERVLNRIANTYVYVVVASVIAPFILLLIAVLDTLVSGLFGLWPHDAVSGMYWITCTMPIWIYAIIFAAIVYYLHLYLKNQVKSFALEDMVSYRVVTTCTHYQGEYVAKVF